MIEKIPPGNTKLGTILVETLSLKKYLHELPKRVIDSIRHNVTLTMETETKSLREELSKTSEILDQLPTSLNVYVEQVNTLKYVKEKQEDFSQKFQTINKLHQLCKQDNIKVSLTLQLAIDEVSHLYESLPKLQKTAAEGLSQNKDTMEKIMQSSSLVLSKKIKAFEKKYVETYLQDKSRLEDCADTLEELFKRSKAIHEIRSKVILYKEFLKLLYEDDPDAQEKLKRNKLQCADDYEFVQSVHKETIKLWKMLLYWRKRRQMCYNSPFLMLDTNKIIRSINKINRYFEEKLSKNEFLRDKSRPLCKVVILQVKETSLIIEFLKDLRKESLQQRHWLQIFNLIKAPHLKNSNTFTIVNLREYHIQNYREEIGVIIEHANTELKYEKIFKSIKEEWEQLELKIIPYKETMDSYILTNTDTLSNAIEENLTTLETISQSRFAEHVRSDISDWVKTLKVMLRNLEIWVNAQKHWINLDPIFQSTQLEEILGQDSQEFQEYRNQFKRIMWSAFKNPKATYNLMITNRVEVFENLISYFSILQKKVHDYLEQRRLAFPRFFFLSDSQFLEFLTLANSNQDFNDYINIMFQGAKSLYINRVLGFKRSQDHEDQQVENLLKLGDGINELKPRSSINDGDTLKDETLENGQNKQKNPYLSKFMNTAEKEKTTLDNNDTLSQDASVREEAYSANSEINNRGNRESIQTQDEGAKLGNIKQGNEGFQVLGMIGQNKELFLFEKSVPMKDGVEQWLLKVEEAMQNNSYKLLQLIQICQIFCKQITQIFFQKINYYYLDFKFLRTFQTPNINLKMTSSMNKIIDNLWLGDMVGAYNKFLLKRNGITHILTVAQGIMPKFPTLFNYKLVNVLDMPSANLKQHFQTCIKYIKDAIAEGGTVYVHSKFINHYKHYFIIKFCDCYAGVSRSTTIIIAYLMQEHGMPYLDALQHCRKCRWFINPNDGFKRQLQTFSRDLANQRKKDGVIEGPSKEENIEILETVVKAPTYDKFSVTDIKFQSKGMMVEGRSGSVPAVIRGIKQTEERSFQPYSPSKMSSGVIPGAQNLQVQKQNSEKIGSRAATTFNQIRVSYQSPVPKSSKTLMTQGLQMRASPIATNSKFIGLKTSTSPYLPQQIQQIKSGVTVKTQMRYPSQNLTAQFGNSSGNYAKGFQISSQMINQAKI